jgi:hypothetical protein
MLMFLVESSSEQKDSLARYHIENLAPEKDGIGTNYRIDIRVQCSVFSFQPEVDSKDKNYYSPFFVVLVVSWLAWLLATAHQVSPITR